MKYIDSHSHLYLAEFDDDRQQAIERAVQSGVEFIFLPNIDSGSITSMLALSHAFPNICFPMIGVHPSSIQENFKNELYSAYAFLKKQTFCAIGEVGIDLYWDKTFAREQEEAFRTQIEWAIEENLPLVIHSRNALNEIFRILKDYKNSSLRGVFHCFPGNIQQAQEAIRMGFLLGIGGVITFKNSGLQKVVADTPAEFLLLETDAPYLTPEPFRGKRNESAYIPYIAKKIAEIKNQSEEQIANITTQNALNLFPLTLTI